MKKQVLILSCSPRKGGNSDALAAAFQKGAMQAGHSVEKLSLAEQELRFCRGCLACQATERCVIQDDMAGILEKMRRAEVLVFATPIYFYEMNGQMKTLLDRSNPLFPAPYAFRDVYLLASAADETASAMDGAIRGLEGWLSCFPQTRLAGLVRGLGLTNLGDVTKHSALLAEAQQLGADL